MNALPKGRLLLDTSAYIRYIRQAGGTGLVEDRQYVERTLLTAVVACELYAGVRHADEKEHLDALCRWHRALGTFTFPGADTWLQAGRLMGRYVRLYGSIRMADHFRDVLVALEAIQHEATLITENVRDFVRWQKLLRASGLDLNVTDLAKLSEA